MSFVSEFGDDVVFIGLAVAGFALFWYTGTFLFLLVGALFGGVFVWTEWTEMSAAKAATEKYYKEDEEKGEE